MSLVHFFKVVLVLWLSLPLTVLSAAVDDKIAMTIYIYHLKPPYVVDLDAKTGLYFDFARHLNQVKDNPYLFTVEYLPRKRLDRFLSEDQIDGMVLGVKPAWFQDDYETRYYWSPPVFVDRDEIISLATNPIEYQGAMSLVGKTIGGVRGYKYHTIDPLFADQRANRVDAASESDLVDLVIKKRVDAAILSRSSLMLLANSADIRSRLYISTTPHDKYFRRILVPSRHLPLFNFLLRHMHSNDYLTQWQQIHVHD